MVFFSFQEVIDAVIMTAAVGFIFMDMFRAHLPKTNPLFYGVDWNAFLFSCAVAAPALIAHELSHKFTAIMFGLEAVFHAAYTWLGIGLVVKFLHSGFIFFVPWFVQISAGATPLQHSLIAFAGPFLNLVLWLCATLVLRKERLSRKQFLFFESTRKLNMFLFIFNMLPIPFFDGWSVYTGLWRVFVG